MAEEQATPVTAFSAAELRASGNDSVQDFLIKDPAFAAPDGGQEGRAQGGAATQTLNLRGLGDRYTLTLVNGRRVTANGAGNILIIPNGAIERIEVLKAGASAIYGSDAVAGAVNIILKKHEDGAWIQGGYGNVTEGSAEVKQVAASLGTGLGPIRMFVAGNYYKRAALDEDDRAITLSEDQRQYGGFDGRSGNTYPARFSLPGRTGSFILDTKRFGPGTFSNNPADYRAYVAETDLYERPGDAISASEKKHVYVSAEYDVGETGLTLFAEGLAGWITGSGKNSTKIPNLTDARIGPVPASNVWNPFGVGLTFPVRVLENGPLHFAIDSRILRSVGGFRANLGEYRLEGAATYYETRTENFSPNHISKSGLRAALNRPGPDAFNPFCNLCNTPAQLAGVMVEAVNSREHSRASMGDIHFSGPLFDLPTGTIQFATGMEYRRERYSVTADAIHLAGDLADSGILEPQHLSRNLTSVFGELRVPLLPSQGLESPLELTLAARHESYSDFGKTFRPLVALRWEAVDGLTLRGSYGKSFRAPYLEEISDNVDSAQINLRDPLTNQIVEVEVRSGGNPNLDPELGSTLTFGAFWRPAFAPNLRFTVDYFRVDQSDIVIAPAAQLIFNGVAPGAVYRDGRARGADEDILIEGPLANAAGRKVRGVDFGVVYSLPGTEYGDFNFDLSWSYLIKYAVDTGLGAGFIDYSGEYSLAQGSNGVRALPKWKGRLGTTWRRDDLSVAFAANYMGKFLQERATATAPRTKDNPGTVRAHLTFDLQASYEFNDFKFSGAENEGVTLSVGAENLFNRQPPFVFAQNGLDRNVYNVRGRYVYVNLGVRF